jgi:hypothetical protein
MRRSKKFRGSRDIRDALRLSGFVSGKGDQGSEEEKGGGILD